MTKVEARWVTGRTSVESDPIGIEGGMNTYGYVYQNPLRYVDPTGEAGIALAVPGTATAAAGNAALARAFAHIASRANPFAVAFGTGFAVGTLAYPIVEPTISRVLDACLDSDSDREKNCRALYDATLQYCKGIPTMRTRQRCFEAAKENYDQCRED